MASAATALLSALQLAAIVYGSPEMKMFEVETLPTNQFCLNQIIEGDVQSPIACVLRCISSQAESNCTAIIHDHQAASCQCGLAYCDNPASSDVTPTTVMLSGRCQKGVL